MIIFGKEGMINEATEMPPLQLALVPKITEVASIVPTLQERSLEYAPQACLRLRRGSMMFVAGPNGSYRSADGYRLRWRGYAGNDHRALFGCACEDYLFCGRCRHSADLSELYEFAAKYYPDAGSTFGCALAYYQAEHCKLKAREEAATGTRSPNDNALTAGTGQSA